MPTMLLNRQRKGTTMEYTETVFTYPGMTVRVSIPKLTEEERTRRMTAIKREAVNLLRSVKD